MQLVDEGGALDPLRAAAAQRSLAREGETDLLAHHLAEIAGVLREPLALGNEARLLIDGPQTHDAMFEAIEAARAHIHLETYILEAGEAGERLAAALATKRSQGVAVSLLYDGVGSIGTPPEYFERLASAGVALCEFNPPNPLKAGRGWRINNRDHRKLLIVDGRVAFTGGINISGVYSVGSFGGRRDARRRTEGWRDTHVRVRGPVVDQFQRLFVNAWARQECAPALERQDYFPGQARAGSSAMRLVAADPETAQSELYLAMLSAIDNARERVWLTYGYFVPDERMLETIRAAARRGVDVRLVLPGFSDFWAPFHAGRAHYSALLEVGVRIFERRDALLHAKTAVIDGVWSSVGSTNLDWRSFVHNYEADLVVLDRDFAHAMEELFGRDVEASHPVTRQEWKRRGLANRLKEWLAQRWEYLL